MKIDKKNILIAVLGLMLIGSVAYGWMTRHSDRQQNKDLERQVDELLAIQKRSAIDRGVSKRMEEIAFQQKLVSDERREKAIEQAHIAEEMTRRSEMERERALQAEKIATASEHAAQEAYQNAERQRQSAEYMRRVADSLNYISLGRSLGMRSYSLYQAGKTEVANLLAYAAYLYTQENGGDLYHPSVYQALVLSSKSKVVYDLQQEAIPYINLIPGKKDHVLTISLLGEVYDYDMSGNQVKSHCLYSDRRYKFRDACMMPDGRIYAVSRTGHVVAVHADKTVVIPTEEVSVPTFITSMGDGRQLLIVGAKGMAILDTGQDRVIGARQLNFQVTCVKTVNGKPLLFDTGGKKHVVHNLNHLTTEKIPVAGVVTEYFSSPSRHLTFYGMKDGTIYCITQNGSTLQLVDHISAITGIRIQGDDLYSSSLDGKLNVWGLTSEKPEPITLATHNSWLMDFVIDRQNRKLWAASADGKLIGLLIDAETMGRKIRGSLSRDLTTEEWNYYIGSGIPYRSFIHQEGRE